MPIPLRELTPEQRAAIARDYGDHAITVAAILARHNIHHRALYGLVRAEDLPLRRAEIAAGADDPFAHGRRAPRPERLTDEALLARERELIDAATAVARRQIRALEVERVLGEDGEKTSRILASTARTLGELGRRSQDSLERFGKLKRLRAQKVHELAQSRPAHEVLADFTRRMPRIAKGETPATDLLEWPRDVLEFMWRRVCPLHDHQLPPDPPWRTWLMLGGRGAGKTRAGAEWVRGLGARARPISPSARAAAASPSSARRFADVREVMIEGPSGLLAVHAAAERPHWKPSLRQLEWPNGAVAHVFSAEDPDALRGPQFEAAWGDELAQVAPRGARPGTCCSSACASARVRAQMVTTTPRPIPLLKRLLADAATVVVTRARDRRQAGQSRAGLSRRGRRRAMPARGSAGRSSTAR